MSTVEARSRADLLKAPLAWGAAGATAFAALHLRDPHTSGTWGHCPFLLLTGQPCPGCGGLRAVNDLTHGDVVAAVSSNLVAVVLVAVLSGAWLVWLVRRTSGRDVGIGLGHRWLVGLTALFLVFGAFRLTAWGAWLQP